MRTRVAVFACLLLAVTAGCSRKHAADPPVATPSVTLDKDRAAIGSPLRITYKFEPLVSIDGEYAVFVHVLDPDGEKLWQDDHLPPVPTSTWERGKPVEYTRTIFVPSYPYIGEAVVRMGLYSTSTGKRLSLKATESARQEYEVSKLTLLPRSENIFLIYRDGWHPQEIDPNDPTSEWQWTKQIATIAFRNPKKDATLYLQYDGRPDLFTPPQQVTVTVAGQPLAAFPADAKDRALKTFPLTAAQFGAGDMSEIGISVDRTFKPASGDVRELGIRLFNVFVEPK
ncbi:MAG: hypothetical protein H0W18_07750 [Acidobacteria bacterium]|nr:hypothetical protein [Acidobacteriota bacterium]